MLVHSVEEVKLLLKEGAIKIPFRVVPVPEAMYFPYRYIHDLDRMEYLVQEALDQSTYCREPTIHIENMSERDAEFWRGIEVSEQYKK